MNPDNHHDIENMQWSPEISDTPPIGVQENGLLLTNNHSELSLTSLNKSIQISKI